MAGVNVTDVAPSVRPLRVPALVLGASYLLAIVLLGPLLGSSADASTAFDEHFNDRASRMRDLLGCAALLLAGAMLTWTAVTARRCTVASAENSIRPQRGGRDCDRMHLRRCLCLADHRPAADLHR